MELIVRTTDLDATEIALRRREHLHAIARLAFGLCVPKTSSGSLTWTFLWAPSMSSGWAEQDFVGVVWVPKMSSAPSDQGISFQVLSANCAF
jgi:hypothetical protein